jgi:hypothetical protein
MVKDTWIVTAYFNPCRYVTKKSNFDMFAARLNSAGAPLLVIELALDDSEFEVNNSHDVIRLRGDSVMWQKERLLNIAIANVPASCAKVAWVDCDLLFEEDEWLQKTSDALDRFMVVQPFSSCVRLTRGHIERRGGEEEEEPITESFAAAFARDRSLARDATYKLHGHTGFAWAARRDLLDACGLYDACLTGSGDHLMAHAFAGALDSRCISAMIGSGHKYAEHFARWAAGTERIGRGSLGYVPGRVLHLWHGAVANRRYYWRNQEFKTFAFDPDRHIRRDKNGLWEWADAPAEMRRWASNLFLSRNEDGDVPLGQGT